MYYLSRSARSRESWRQCDEGDLAELSTEEAEGNGEMEADHQPSYLLQRL